MVAPTVSNVFWIGVDNALIQVPQNYTVPANPPSTPNPPVNSVIASGTAQIFTTNTVLYTTLLMTPNAYVGYILTYTTGPAAGETEIILSNTASTITTNPFPSTPVPGNSFQVILPTPTSGGTTTTKDSVTVYVSAIKGFNNPLTLSFFLQKVDSTVDPNISAIDSTVADWVGNIGTSPTSWTTGTYTTLPTTESGWAGYIPAYSGGNAILQPNSGNVLNTYATTNYQTLFINPETTGGVINPSFPPSYKVNIFAYDSVTNTYAACSFTLVVLPSVATYGLGVLQKTATANTYVNVDSSGLVLHVKSTKGFEVGQQIVIGKNTARCEVATIGVVNATPVSFFALNTGPMTYSHTAAEADTVSGNMVFTNSVNLLRNGHDPSIGSFVTLYYYFYPLEPTASVPNPITITLQDFSSQLIDTTNSTISSPYYSGGTPVALSAYTNQIVIPSSPTSITGDNISQPVIVTLYLANVTYNASDPTTYHTLLKLIGTDINGVTTTSYTVVTSAN